MRYPQALPLLIPVALAATLSASSVASTHRQALAAARFASLSTNLSPADARQLQCAAAAREQFHRLGWDRNPLAKVINHYSDRRKRCFVELEGAVQGSRDVEVFRSLGDTTGREYANYLSVGARGAEPDRASTLLCEFMLRSGEVFECRSSGEFDIMAREYMQ